MLLTNYKDKPLENFSKFFLDATIGVLGVCVLPVDTLDKMFLSLRYPY
jgi:hypothetical protein